MDELEASSLSLAFGQKRILSNAYLACRTGDVLAIFGRNGAGKSTLLRALFGLQPLQSGCVRMNGANHPRPYVRPGLVRYLPQEPFLPHDATVDWALRAFLPDAAAREALAADGRIGPNLRKRADQLSSGTLRYLEFSLVYHAGAKFILLDEPFAKVEPILVEKMLETLAAGRGGHAVILSDHDYRDALRAANRLCLLRGGRLRELAGAADLVDGGYLNRL